MFAALPSMPTSWFETSTVTGWSLLVEQNQPNSSTIASHELHSDRITNQPTGEHVSSSAAAANLDEVLAMCEVDSSNENLPNWARREPISEAVPTAHHPTDLTHNTSHDSDNESDSSGSSIERGSRLSGYEPSISGGSEYEYFTAASSQSLSDAEETANKLSSLDYDLQQKLARSRPRPFVSTEVDFVTASSYSSFCEYETTPKRKPGTFSGDMDYKSRLRSKQRSFESDSDLDGYQSAVSSFSTTSSHRSGTSNGNKDYTAKLRSQSNDYDSDISSRSRPRRPISGEYDNISDLEYETAMSDFESVKSRSYNGRMEFGPGSRSGVYDSDRSSRSRSAYASDMEYFTAASNISSESEQEVEETVIMAKTPKVDDYPSYFEQFAPQSPKFRKPALGSSSQTSHKGNTSFNNNNEKFIFNRYNYGFTQYLDSDLDDHGEKVLRLRPPSTQQEYSTAVSDLSDFHDIEHQLDGLDLLSLPVNVKGRKGSALGLL